MRHPPTLPVTTVSSPVRVTLRCWSFQVAYNCYLSLLMSITAQFLGTLLNLVKAANGDCQKDSITPNAAS